MSRPLRQGSAEARALYELMSGVPQVALADTGGDDPILVACRIVQRMVEEHYWPVHVSLAMDDTADLDPWVERVRGHLQGDGLSVFVARSNSATLVKFLVGQVGIPQWELHFQSLKSRELSATDLTIIDPRLVSGRVKPAPNAIAGQILRLGKVRLRYTFGSRPFTARQIPTDIILAGAPS